LRLRVGQDCLDIMADPKSASQVAATPPTPGHSADARTNDFKKCEALGKLSVDCQMQAQYRGNNRDVALRLCKQEIEAYKTCLKVAGTGRRG